MKLIKYTFTLAILMVFLVIGSKAWSWYQVERAKQLKLEAAEATTKRQSYLTDQMRNKRDGLPQVYDTSIDGSLSAAGKARAALPDQNASVNGTSGNYNPRSR